MIIILTMMMIKIVTSRVIGALGPRPLGGAPGAPGAPPAPPPAGERNISSFSSFVFSGFFVKRLRLFFQSVCAWDIDMGEGLTDSCYLLHFASALKDFFYLFEISFNIF